MADPQTLVNDNPGYGPSRPEPDVGYKKFTTPKYVSRYSQKIAKDLIRVARMYSGRAVRLFVVDKSDRCPVCTNTVTGEKLTANCPKCHGTGYIDSWTCLGSFWSYVDFGPAYKMATPLGSTENPNGVKQQIVLLDAPILHDQALIIFEESREVYKIYDVEPHIVAMRGDVVAQIASCTRLAPGCIEYNLITW